MLLTARLGQVNWLLALLVIADVGLVRRWSVPSRRLVTLGLCGVLYEGLHPGRSAVLIVARAAAVVLVVVGLPVDEGQSRSMKLHFPSPPT